METKQPMPTLERNPANFYLRAVVDTFYSIQHHRIKAGNRVGAYVKLGVSEDQADSLHRFVDERLMDTEDSLGKLIEREVKKEEIWNRWLLGVKGIGPKLAGSLVARIAPFATVDAAGQRVPRFGTISKLWRISGLAVVNGEAEHPIRGERIHYDPVLKTTCWKIGEQFVKQGKFYRARYDEFKAKLREQHPVPVDTGKLGREKQKIMDFTDGHVHRMAKRKVVKLFMAHLWLKWAEIEGLSVSDPYSIKIMGHTGLIKPPESES